MKPRSFSLLALSLVLFGGCEPQNTVSGQRGVSSRDEFEESIKVIHEIGGPARSSWLAVGGGQLWWIQGGSVIRAGIDGNSEMEIVGSNGPLSAPIVSSDERIYWQDANSIISLRHTGGGSLRLRLTWPAAALTFQDGQLFAAAPGCAAVARIDPEMAEHSEIYPAEPPTFQSGETHLAWSEGVLFCGAWSDVYSMSQDSEMLVSVASKTNQVGGLAVSSGQLFWAGVEVPVAALWSTLEDEPQKLFDLGVGETGGIAVSEAGALFVTSKPLLVVDTNKPSVQEYDVDNRVTATPVVDDDYVYWIRRRPDLVSEIVRGSLESL